MEAYWLAAGCYGLAKLQAVARPKHGGAKPIKPGLGDGGRKGTKLPKTVK